MSDYNAFHSVLKKKNELDHEMLDKILTALSAGLNANPDVYIMVKVREISEQEFDDFDEEEIDSDIVQGIRFKLSGGKGNPPGTNSL